MELSAFKEEIFELDSFWLMRAGLGTGLSGLATSRIIQNYTGLLVNVFLFVCVCDREIDR